MAGGRVTPERPILLLTRPEAGSRAFLEALTERGVTGVTAIVSPLFDYEAVEHALVEPGADLIFTSGEAVRHAGPGAGRLAWCVGDHTARTAAAAGFVTRNAGGDANDLIALIRSAKPERKLVHFRGEVSAADICGALSVAGLNCSDRIVYRKIPKPLAEDADAALMGKTPVLLPLFSPETATLLVDQGPFAAPITVCALSENVARASVPLDPVEMKISAKPDLATMVRLVAGLIA